MKQNFTTFHQQCDLGKKIVKTNNVADGLNKMCSNSGAVLNKKYTDATTQLQ